MAVATTTAAAVTTFSLGGDGATVATAGPDAAVVVAPPDACAAASVEQRAGLVLVTALPGVTEADDPLVDRLVEIGVGGVMLRDDNIDDEEQVIELVDGLRDRLGDHLLVALDEEGGRVSSLAALGERLPSARRLGRAGADAAFEAGEELGALAAAIGVDWVFAPVLDLDDGRFDGVIGDRSFGADPVEVAEAARAFVRGVRDHGVAVTLKHFPGHGGESDPHTGAVEHVTSLELLLGRELLPFDALLADGAETVMVGHVAYPDVWSALPASLEPGAYELLRARGFDGVAITDAIGMGAVHPRWGFDVAPAMALDAGADAVLVNQGWRVSELRDGLVAAIGRGDLDEARLDEAVSRVLTLAGAPADGIVCAQA